jgi:hypothetical protein
MTSPVPTSLSLKVLVHAPKLKSTPNLYRTTTPARFSGSSNAWVPLGVHALDPPDHRSDWMFARSHFGGPSAALRR